MASDKQTISKVRSVAYVPLNFAGGLTDLTLTIRRPNGTIFNTIVMDEQSGGIYTASYTPDALGQWQEKVSSVVNGDNVIRAYDSVAFDATDVKTQTNAIETKVDTIDTEVGVVDGKVDAVQTTANTIDGKVDIVDTNVDSVKTTVEATDGKVDAVQSDVTYIKGKVDSISDNVNPGGYFAG